MEAPIYFRALRGIYFPLGQEPTAMYLDGSSQYLTTPQANELIASYFVLPDGTSPTVAGLQADSLYEVMNPDYTITEVNQSFLPVPFRMRASYLGKDTIEGDITQPDLLHLNAPTLRNTTGLRLLIDYSFAGVVSAQVRFHLNGVTHVGTVSAPVTVDGVLTVNVSFPTYTGPALNAMGVAAVRLSPAGQVQGMAVISLSVQSTPQPLSVFFNTVPFPYTLSNYTPVAYAPLAGGIARLYEIDRSGTSLSFEVNTSNDNNTFPLINGQLRPFSSDDSLTLKQTIVDINDPVPASIADTGTSTFSKILALRGPRVTLTLLNRHTLHSYCRIIS